MMRVLTFLRLVDENGNLSLTNIAVIVSLVKLAMTPTVSMTDTGALLVSVLNYAYKRFSQAPDADDDGIPDAVEANTKAIEDLSSKLDMSLRRVDGNVNALDGKVIKITEQISKANLVAAFSRPAGAA